MCLRPRGDRIPAMFALGNGFTGDVTPKPARRVAKSSSLFITGRHSDGFQLLLETPPILYESRSNVVYGLFNFGWEGR